MAKLYFRYGAMNSGKTTSLIQVAYNYEENKMKAIIVKPAIATRGNEKIVSRIGAERKVDILLDTSTNIYDEIKKSKVDCVLVDEAQFLTKEQVDQLFMVAVELNIPVICYGIRTDFISEGFEGAIRLLLIAHSIEELKTICSCGKKAIFSARKVDGKLVFEGDQVAIDDADEITYESFCGLCYYRKKGNK